MRAGIIFVLLLYIQGLVNCLVHNGGSINSSVTNEQIKWRYKDNKQCDKLKAEKIKTFRIHKSIGKQCDSIIFSQGLADR